MVVVVAVMPMVVLVVVVVCRHAGDPATGGRVMRPSWKLAKM